MKIDSTLLDKIIVTTRLTELGYKNWIEYIREHTHTITLKELEDLISIAKENKADLLIFQDDNKEKFVIRFKK